MGGSESSESPPPPKAILHEDFDQALDWGPLWEVSSWQGTSLGNIPNDLKPIISSYGAICKPVLPNLKENYEFRFHFGAAPPSSPQHLEKPCAVAIDPHGNFFVLDQGHSRIQVFNHDGTWVRSLGSPGQFLKPSGIAFEWSGQLVVMDSGHAKIAVIDAKTGEHKFNCNATVSTNGLAAGVCMDLYGNITAALTSQCEICIFDHRDGRLIHSFDTKEWPHAIALDCTGNFVVQQTKIEIFDPTGKLLRSLSDLELYVPWGSGKLITIAKNGDMVLSGVTDDGILVYSKEGKLLKTIEAAFTQPMAILDRKGNLVIWDLNRRVQVWG